ncbi:MAG: TetR/AcrR family transcriptional regulator, partial [Rhodospirillales bacterium]|nr:TetR/AcrR family transcriptional regulator [Rhodospirillales bacterium]
MNTHDATNLSSTLPSEPVTVRPEFPASLSRSSSSSGPASLSGRDEEEARRDDGSPVGKAHRRDLTAGAAGEATTASPTQLSREQILDATEHCLNATGYDKTTIRAIAKQLDCAVGSIYRYFTGKRNLLDAVTQRRFEPVTEAVAAGAPMQRTLRAYAQTATEQPEQYRLMFWLASVGQRDGGAAVPAVTRQIIEGWSRQLGDPQLAQRMWAQLHGHLMLGVHIDQTLRALEQLNAGKLAASSEGNDVPADAIDPLGGRSDSHDTAPVQSS